MFWKLSLPIEPLIFIFYFTVEGYNLYVTIELFPHIDVMMAENTMNSPDRHMQKLSRVNTFLNLLGSHSQYALNKSHNQYWWLGCCNLTRN